MYLHSRAEKVLPNIDLPIYKARSPSSVLTCLFYLGSVTDLQSLLLLLLLLHYLHNSSSSSYVNTRPLAFINISISKFYSIDNILPNPISSFLALLLRFVLDKREIFLADNRIAKAPSPSLRILKFAFALGYTYVTLVL